jgi:hypothetical protein
MGDYYNRPVDHIDLPVYAEYVSAFERLALEREPGADAVSLVGDVLAEHLRRPVIASELGRLRRRDDVAEAERILNAPVYEGGSSPERPDGEAQAAEARRLAQT